MNGDGSLNGCMHSFDRRKWDETRKQRPRILTEQGRERKLTVLAKGRERDREPMTNNGRGEYRNIAFSLLWELEYGAWVGMELGNGLR